MHLLIAFLFGLIVGVLAAAIFGRKFLSLMRQEIAVLTTAVMRLEARLIRNKVIATAVEVAAKDVATEVRNKV